MIIAAFTLRSCTVPHSLQVHLPDILGRKANILRRWDKSRPARPQGRTKRADAQHISCAITRSLNVLLNAARSWAQSSFSISIAALRFAPPVLNVHAPSSYALLVSAQSPEKLKVTRTNCPDPPGRANRIFANSALN